MENRGLVLRIGAAVVAVVLVALVVVLVVSQVGGDSSSDPRVLPAGQVDIQLPEGWKVVDGRIQKPAASASAAMPTGTAADGSAVTTTTVKKGFGDAASDMFSALSKFRACLDGEGVTFIGAPDRSNPDSPSNDPDYIKALSTCAARSNIVAALQAQQAASDSMTPEEIQTANKGYLSWRKCMIAKGWKIAVPTPDEKGRLFVFNTGSGNSNNITPPPGKDVISSTDTQDCAAKSRAETQKNAKK